MKNDVLEKLMLQDREALRAIELPKEGAIIVLYGNDEEGMEFLTDKWRRKTDVALAIETDDVCAELERSSANVYLIEDELGLIDSKTFYLLKGHTSLVCCGRERPTEDILSGTGGNDILLFEIKRANTITKITLAEKLCKKYSYQFDEAIVKSIVSKAETVSEIRDGIFKRLDRVIRIKSELCHAFDAKPLRTTYFLLLHLVAIIITAVFCALCQVKGVGDVDLGLGIATQCISTVFLVLIERNRCETCFGVIFNSLASFVIGTYAVLVNYLLK